MSHCKLSAALLLHRFCSVCQRKAGNETCVPIEGTLRFAASVRYMTATTREFWQTVLSARSSTIMAALLVDVGASESRPPLFAFDLIFCFRDLLGNQSNSSAVCSTSKPNAYQSSKSLP